MVEASASMTAKALAPLVGTVATTVRQLHSERQAGQAPLQVQTDLLNQTLRTTLRRLQGGQVDDTWWRLVLTELAHAYVAPTFFGKPAVRNWLDLPDVQDRLLALARAKVLGLDQPDEPAIRERLAERYSEQTGDATRFAELPIDVAVASLTAGYIASIPPEQRSLAGMLQAGQGEVIKQVAKIREQLDGTLPTAPLVRDALGDLAAQDLSAILELRMFDFEAATGRIIALWRRVERGDLVIAPAHLKNLVCYWAARLLAANSDTLPDARALRQTLPDGYTEANLRILDAIIKASQNQEAAAIRLLRDDSDPEARSVLLGLMIRFRGPEEAYAWCNNVSPSTNLTHFVDFGWRNWAVCLAHLGRWKEAADGLRMLASLDSHWPPVLATLEATINAALLLPAERRSAVLEGLPIYVQISLAFEPDTMVRHSRAVECFNYVEGCLPIGADKARQEVADWLIWLQLMHPDAAKADSARTDLRARLEAGEAGIGIVSLAWAFAIEFNQDRLRDHLRRREQLGGLEDEDVFVECLLNQTTLSPREFAAYVDERLETLDRIMQKSVTTVMLFEALLADRQLERAKKVIENRGSCLDSESVARMTAVLQGERQGDPRRELEEQYRKSKQALDLRNLIAHLAEVGDRHALEPLVRELFDQEPTLPNAYEVVRTLSLPPTDHRSVAEFLQAHPSVVQRNDDMKSALAWGLFHVGRVDESREINLELVAQRRHQNDLSLDVNLAVATGDWERLASIVDREWPHRAEHDTEVVLMLARLASQVGQFERAINLANMAATKAPDDPNVLIAVHGIFIQLGRDQEADPRWLAAALEHSSEQGPVWAVELQELANDWVPQWRERSTDIERKLLDGQLPMALATDVMNMPLSRVLLAESPGGVRDGRKRPVIPIISGVRGPADIHEGWTVGLDVTSIMLLGRLGLLDRFLNALNHVKIAPDVMGCLLAERAAARFHQPVRVEAARQVRNLIDRDRIKVIERPVSIERELSKEVGPDLAALLEASRTEEGVTICARPIHKASTLKQEPADTSEYDDLILSPADLCAIARRAGRINSDEHERAKSFLSSQGQVAGKGLSTATIGRPIYLDRLAVSYLQSARVLEPLANSGLDLRIHPNVSDETNAFIEAGETGDQLAKAVEGVRESLRRGMETGKISLLPQRPHGADAGLGSFPSVISIEGLMWGAGECDALCVDDRFTNSHPFATDPTGTTVPVVCVLDVLRYLQSIRVVSPDNYWAARHRLRDAGYAFIPVEADELLHHLLAAEFEDARVLESAELRSIRQTVNRIDALGLLKAEEAQALSQGLLMACVQVIRTLWRDASLTASVAATLSSWIWRYLPVTTHLVKGEATNSASSMVLEEVVSRRLGLLMMAPMMDSTERRSAYREWLELCVVAPLMPASADLIDNAASIVRETVDSMTAEHRKMIGALFLECLPDGLQDRMLKEYPTFATDCGFEFRPVLTVAGRVRVEEAALVQAAKALFVGAGEQVLVDLDGLELKLDFAENDILRLTWTQPAGAHQQADIPHLTLIAEKSSERAKVAERILGRLGPAIQEGTRTLLKESVSRRLSPEELSAIFLEETTGVAAIQSQLSGKIAGGWQPSLDDLVPPTRPYWERFCGPVPTNEDPDRYFVEELIPYRRALIESNLPLGLDISCLGALRDDLSPGSWLEGVDDETALSALQTIPIGGNPIALLGVLDVALYRIGDGRFRNIAEQVTRTLLDESIGFSGGYSGYRFLEILIDFEMNRVALVEGVGKCPGFWRRMSAWMQAGLIARNSFVYGALPQLDQLEIWCRDRMTPQGSLRRLADCRNEPIVLGHMPRLGRLRHEVLLRLGLLKERHEAAGREVPLSADVDGALAEARRDASGALWAARGPAELHVLPDSPISETAAEMVAKSWNSDGPTKTLAALAGMSQIFVLGDEELVRVRSFLEEIPQKTSELDVVIPQLHAASIIAGTTGNRVIADAIGKAVANFATALSDPMDVEPMMHTLLQAAAAYREDAEWREWIGERLVDTADALPTTNDCLAWMLSLMEWLDMAMPVGSWFHGRAKSLATAGLEATT